MNECCDRSNSHRGDAVQWLRVLDPERDAEGRERYPLVKKGILLFQQRLPWMGIAGGAAALIGLRIDPSLLNSTLAFWCLVCFRVIPS